MNRDSFYRSVAEALSGCQLVEQELKLYISEALELTRHYVAGRFPFKLSGVDYHDASLERLIETFKKLNDNDVLLSNLKKFKIERNFLSHQGIARCLDFEGELIDAKVEKYAVQLDLMQTEASRLQLLIFSEAVNIKRHDLGSQP